MRSRKSKPPAAGNLVLARKQGEIINLHTSDGLATIKIKRIKPEAVWLTLNAPASVSIIRSEIDASQNQADQ